MSMSVAHHHPSATAPRGASPLLSSSADGPSTGPAPRDEVIDVLFPLFDDDEWPPYPVEQVDAVLLSHDLAEIRGVPWFVTNLSRGDIVKVRSDGIGYVGGAIVSRGGHSTIHVMATSSAELAPVERRLQSLGACTSSGLTPPMLTVDVPESCRLEAILDVLAEAESMTCAHSVACRQHRAPVAG